VKRRTEVILGLILIAVGLPIAVALGVFAYVSATARPLHPDVQQVPSMARSAPPEPWADVVQNERVIVRRDVAEQNLPGLSVAVGVNGAIVWAEGFGYADLDRRTPVTPDTRFRIGEVSIPLTSAAVGLLLESHRLNLDDRIQLYVPEFPDKRWPVTLRELMGNVAGIRADAGDEESLAPCQRTLDALERFADRPLLFEPGTRVRPSSYGWILISAAIEAAARQPFFTFMKTRIFDPAGMAATTRDSAAEQTPDRTTFYFPRFGGDPHYGPDVARDGDHTCWAGAGGFLSTPSDLVRFAIALDSGRILQPATVATLWTPQRLASGEETGYGLGWRVETVSLAGEPARLASHGTKKDFMGGTASLLTFPDRGIAVGVTSNTSFADTRTIALKIADAFAGRLKPPAATRRDDTRSSR
jgi:CubicO group peptidase (beta-lactamase class C family)